MFTDMVGYTALMQQDEHRAREVRDRHRSVLRESIEGHGGEIVQFYGDGTLSVFASAVDAVHAAVQIQRRLRRPPEIPVRIGLHVGDIVHDEDGVHGDGVNVAARVQGKALPGSVVLSGRVYEELRNHPEIPVVSLGDVRLKNVHQPMPLFAVSFPELVLPDPLSVRAEPRGPRRTLAVLPFVNMSSDPDNEFFADGVTEEIINALTRIEGLQVTARTSSFAFKGRNEDVRRIGAELGVSHVLEGSVRRAGERVRIAAQLIDTRDGYHVFSNVYDQVLEDVFEAQDEIARRITEELRATLPGVDRGPIVRRPTENREAHDLYLRGMHHWYRWTPDHVTEALQHYHEAVGLDPDFAQAHAGIAHAYVFLGATGRLACGNAYPRAKEAALRAIELDSSDWRSHAALGLVKLFYEWDFASAGTALREAVRLGPGASEAHNAYALYLLAVGRTDELVEESETALALDPLSPIMNEGLARSYLSARRPEEALAQFERTLALAPDFRAAAEGKGFAYLALERLDEAVEAMRAYKSMTPGGRGGQGPLGFVLGMAGRHEEARLMLDELLERERAEPNHNLHVDVAAVHVGLGELDAALERIERAAEARVGGLVFLRHGHSWDRLRADPRLDELLARYGI